MGFTVTYFLAFILLLAPQTSSLDSASPKERESAIQQMAVIGNRDAIPKIAAALKKESKGDLRAEMVAGLGRIHDREAIPVLADTLRTDLDKEWDPLESTCRHASLSIL